MDPLYKERITQTLVVPDCLKDLTTCQCIPTAETSSSHEIQKTFPHLHSMPKVTIAPGTRAGKPLKVGVVLSGGQAAGGHNVITGLYDALKQCDPHSSLIGFLNGPSGIVDGNVLELTSEFLDTFRNTGGFDMIGSGRTKIETDEQLACARRVIESHALDGLVVIGGDDSNTNAAILGEYLATHGVTTSVIGVPKTIDGDLQTEDIEISFGFDTATKTYAEMIGNIARDALSAKKYFHVIKLMGRSASHIALECALKTHPNCTFISEEIAEKKRSLRDVVAEFADCIEERARAGKHYGVALIPEGLIEFIPEMKVLITALNTLLSTHKEVEAVIAALSAEERDTFQQLPESIQRELLLERDPHGNVQVSHIATDVLLVHLVKKELDSRGFTGAFSPVHHFFGYEGRAGYPSLFDATYCYALGRVAALLVKDQKNGYIASLQGLTKPAHMWTATGIPIPSLFTFETRKGTQKAVIKKALVSLTGKAFATFAAARTQWIQEDAYEMPGPIQFFGPDSVTWTVPQTLTLR